MDLCLSWTAFIPGWSAVPGGACGKPLLARYFRRRLNRDSPATNDLPITMRLSEAPTPLEFGLSA